VGAVTVSLGFNYLLIFSIAGLVVGLAAILAAPAPVRELGDADKPSISLGTVRKNIAYITQRKMLFSLFIIGVAAAGLKAPLDEYHALFFESRGSALVSIGLIVASFELVKALGSMIAGRIPINASQQKYLLLVIGLLLGTAVLVPPIVSVVLLVLVIIVDMILWISNDDEIQKAAASHNRATLASVKMFLGEVTAIIAFGAFSLLTARYAVSSVYLASGMALIVISCFVFLIPGTKKQHSRGIL